MRADQHHTLQSPDLSHLNGSFSTLGFGDQFPVFVFADGLLGLALRISFHLIVPAKVDGIFLELGNPDALYLLLERLN